MALSDTEMGQLCQSPPPETKDFSVQQIMLRIKDPRRSLPFYTGVLGMRLLEKHDFPGAKFSLYFLGYVEGDLPTEPAARREFMLKQKALIELTHNWGSELEGGESYHSGNTEPRGFGHIGIVVPDLDVACARFEKLGVTFKKRPDEGTMKTLAFVLDPDGYWIEIIGLKKRA